MRLRRAVDTAIGLYRVAHFTIGMGLSLRQQATLMREFQQAIPGRILKDNIYQAVRMGVWCWRQGFRNTHDLSKMWGMLTAHVAASAQASGKVLLSEVPRGMTR